MADTLAFGASAPAYPSHAAPTRWEARQAVRLGQAADIKIYPEGARASAGAIATVHVRDGREASAAAYAALIAAAPELVHLLGVMTDLAEAILPDDQELRERYQDDIAAADALLARLEGGAI